jgi:hypothetical protein
VLPEHSHTPLNRAANCLHNDSCILARSGRHSCMQGTARLACVLLCPLMNQFTVPAHLISPLPPRGGPLSSKPLSSRLPPPGGLRDTSTLQPCTPATSGKSNHTAQHQTLEASNANASCQYHCCMPMLEDK